MPLKKVLIFNPFGIGDVLFTTPLIRNLKDNGMSLIYLCNKRVYPIMKNHLLLDEVWVFEKDDWRALAKQSGWKFFKQLVLFRRKVAAKRFDAVIDLSLNSQYGLFFKLCGIKSRLGMNYKNRGRFLTGKIEIPGGYKDKHVARYYLDTLGLLGISPKEHRFELFVSDLAQAKVRQILADHRSRPIVVVCPGSGDSWDQTAYFKRWPQENFARLCGRLQKEAGVVIVLAGSLGEKQLCEAVAEKLPDKPIDLCGKIDLEEFCAVVAQADLLVTNDGGPFHIAQALGKKAVVFFGPVNEKVYGVYPDSAAVKALVSGISCRPCYSRFRFPACAIDKKCLRDISVEQAWEAVKSLL